MTTERLGMVGVVVDRSRSGCGKGGAHLSCALVEFDGLRGDEVGDWVAVG